MAIAGNFKPVEDSLGFTAQSGITGSFNATTGVLTLSGSATVAQYQAALRSVTYTNGAAAPDTSARTVTLVATDGTASSNTASRGIAVAAAPNQRPVVTTSAALAYTPEAARAGRRRPDRVDATASISPAPRSRSRQLRGDRRRPRFAPQNGITAASRDDRVLT